MKVLPESIELTEKQQQQFKIDTNDAVDWTLDKPEVGSLSKTGVYTAPRIILSPQTVIVTAIKKSDPATHSSAVVTLQDTRARTTILVLYWIVMALLLLGAVALLLPKLRQPKPTSAVYVTPRAITLTSGSQHQFAARVVAATNEAQAKVVWSASAGKIDPTGHYVAPTSNVPQAATVTAISAPEPKQSGDAFVYFADTKMAVAPEFASIKEAQPVQFRVAIDGPAKSNATDRTVKWSIIPEGLGTISPDGLYIAPETLMETKNVTIVARLSSEPRVEAAAVVRLLASDCWGVDAVTRAFFIFIMGAIGGLLHGAASHVTYLGNQTFTPSWFWWYLFRPFVGGLLAFIFLFLIDGGFIAGESSSSHLPRVAAIAALLGLFAEDATQWLGQIAKTFFAPRGGDQRKDKVDKPDAKATPKITGVTPPLNVGQTDDVVIAGTGFVSGAKVKVNDVARPATFVNATNLKVTLTTTDTANAGKLMLRVVNPDGQESNEWPFEIK